MRRGAFSTGTRRLGLRLALHPGTARSVSCRDRARGLRVAVRLWSLAAVVQLSFVLLMLPISVSGLGLREATFGLHPCPDRSAPSLAQLRLAESHRIARSSASNARSLRTLPTSTNGAGTTGAPGSGIVRQTERDGETCRLVGLDVSGGGQRVDPARGHRRDHDDRGESSRSAGGGHLVTSGGQATISYSQASSSL